MMVFVVPQENLKGFKYQADLDDIRQFVMFPDHVVCAERSEGGKRKRSELVAK
jgi:hypothetical protein